MRWGDFAAGWHIISSRIVAVSPAGHTIEVIARAPAQILSRAHILTFKVDGHEHPTDDLAAATDLVAEARPSSLPSITWHPVKKL